MGGEVAHGGRHSPASVMTDQTERRVSQSCHHVRCTALAHLAHILSHRHVAHPVQAVLDLPVRPHRSQHRVRIGLAGRQTRHDRHRLTPRLSVLAHVAIEQADLSDSRPVDAVSGRERQRALLVAVAALAFFTRDRGRGVTTERGVDGVEKLALVLFDRENVGPPFCTIVVHTSR